LSRACLGKMIVFIYKWLKNPVFFRRPPNCLLKPLGQFGARENAV
jgi:hypothetical protein